MKYFMLILILLTTNVQALPLSPTMPEPPRSVVTPEPTLVLSPTIENYDSLFVELEDMTKNFTSFDSWKEISFKNKNTNKITEWKDLSDYEKSMFCLSMAKRLTAYFSKIDSFWQNELQKFDKPDFRLISKVGAKDKEKAASKEDVQLYIEKLTDLRKKFAITYEEFAIESFKKYEKEIPDFERQKILQDIRDYHDKHHLIERK